MWTNGNRIACFYKIIVVPAASFMDVRFCCGGVCLELGIKVVSCFPFRWGLLMLRESSR